MWSMCYQATSCSLRTHPSAATSRVSCLSMLACPKRVQRVVARSSVGFNCWTTRSYATSIPWCLNRGTFKHHLANPKADDRISIREQATHVLTPVCIVVHTNCWNITSKEPSTYSNTRSQSQRPLESFECRPCV
jgi:hypothetical protein